MPEIVESGDGAVRGAQDDDEQRDAEGASDLPGGLVDGTADGEALGCRLDTAAALRTGKVRPIPSPVISVAGNHRVT